MGFANKLCRGNPYGNRPENFKKEHITEKRRNFGDSGKGERGAKRGGFAQGRRTYFF